MRLTILLFGFVVNLLLVTSDVIEEKILRGEFHDENVRDIDYEDSSNNLTDYASRKTSDFDIASLPGEKNESRSSDEEEEKDSSDISEERDRDTVDNNHLKSLPAMKVSEKKKDQIVSIINKAFNDRKTFSCPRTKTDLLTGTSIGDLSPEDISLISAMGDALATGVGLWPNADIEFRGASFPIGGDSTIDGLVTVPNILREFNPRLLGVSHGMGTVKELPDHQLNVAETGALTENLPKQAIDLVEKLKRQRDVDYTNSWVMIIISIGTEQLCSQCTAPDYHSIEKAINYLQIHVPKALVVLLGPVHVSSFHNQKANLLKTRCACLRNESDSFLYDLTNKWAETFEAIQKHVSESEMARPTFGLLSFPMITITSRYPSGLFMPDRPLLNRRGHNYATKWLWNRLIGGDKYNLSSATLSQDNYFCPSTGCPYFRTELNEQGCQLLRLEEAKEKEITVGNNGKLFKKPRRTRHYLYIVAVVILITAFFLVFVLGTIFYQWSKLGTHGRFEIVEEPQRKLEEAQKEEEVRRVQKDEDRMSLLVRQNTRANSEMVLNSVPMQPLSASRHKSFRTTIDGVDPRL